MKFSTLCRIVAGCISATATAPASWFPDDTIYALGGEYRLPLLLILGVHWYCFAELVDIRSAILRGREP